MNIKEVYDLIYMENKTFIETGGVVIDPYLGTKIKDKRRGLSLIIPLIQIANNYELFINGFRTLEPEQYYYPKEDLHITIFDYIAASDTYIRDETTEQIFINITNEAVKSFKIFNVIFNGIVFSREAGLLKGYDNGSIVAFRKRIREKLKDNGIPNMERYESRTVHSTCIRFMNRIQNVNGFIRELEARREYEIGEEIVKRILLIEHDWYNRKSSMRIIKEYIIN